jgi:UDP-GlcNAc:undecaprenyl-phosphate GlcNAc-1-phosphate transferase
LGGLALTAAWSVPVVALFFLDPVAHVALQPKLLQLVALVVGGVAMCGVGAFDDTRGLRAVHKLAAQVVLAVFAFSCGFRIEAIQLPAMGALPMGVFALPITVIWIVGVTNAVNLIDGLDGLAAGVSFFAAFTSFVIASLSGSHGTALLMAALMGALVGFLFFNFNPARIFMGDSGSYFLGYVLATSALGGSLQQKASTAVSLLVPVLALGVPIFDTLFSMMRRFLERKPVFSPDRGHVHHRLLDLGLTHRRAVIVLYGVSIALAGGAIAISLGRSWHVGVALLSVTLVFVGLVRFLGYFEYLHFRRRQKSRLRDPFTEQLRVVVPKLILDLHAREDANTLSVLETLTQITQISCVELTAADGVTQRWSREPGDCAARDLMFASFPIGRDDCSRARLKFGWRSELEDPAPQVDVLLQILVDALAYALTLSGSELAPVPPAAEPAPVSGAVVAPSYR